MSVKLEMDELAVAMRASQLVTTQGGDLPASPSTSSAKEKGDQGNSGGGSSPTSKNVRPPEAPAPGLAGAAEAKDKAGEKYDRWTLRDVSASPMHVGCVTLSSSPKGKPYYITTAINYANGPAHMGHAYEGVTADIIARYYRVATADGCYFVTGADEHGQKIAGVAEKEKITPFELVTKYVNGFKVLNQREFVSNDDYVRTTSERHKRTAKELWRMCSSKGDIYLDNYSGWYNVREETFVSENDAKLTDYKDPASQLPLKKVEEASYFFKMSKYQDRLVEHIEANPLCIQPETQRKFILARLKEPLRDLSISRTTFNWGIPVPEGFEKDHVMYVWFDALTNYLTGVDALGVNEDGSPAGLKKSWPCDVHIIGKDIIWFHCVIWPCMLMSADIPLPKCVFAHGFVNDKEGKKMSKSFGNVIDPHDLLDKYCVDTFRWYLAKEAPYGNELSFSEESLATMHNADLCNTLGNLVHRALNLSQKYCGGVVPDVPLPEDLPVDVAALRSKSNTLMETFQLDQVASIAIAAFRDINKYLTDSAPWKMKGDDNDIPRKVVIRTMLECVYACTHFLIPFIPEAAEKIFKKLNTDAVVVEDLSIPALVVGTKVDVGSVLFDKIVSEEERTAEMKAKELAEAQAKKKEKQKKNVEKSKNANSKSNEGGDPNQSEFTKIDIRVGRIEKVWYHEEADKLFCEEIDVGESEGPRQITSGLREHYTLEEMKGRLVLVVCNLKASKIIGFVSNGMVLAAKGDGNVELVEAPEGSEVGERVFIDGLSGEPYSSSQVKKKKIWEAVAKGLVSSEGGLATWEGGVMKTSKGACKCKSLVGAAIA